MPSWNTLYTCKRRAHGDDPGQRMTNDETIFAIHALFRAHGIYFSRQRSTVTNADDVWMGRSAYVYYTYTSGRYKNGGYLSPLRGVSLRRGNHRFQLSERLADSYRYLYIDLLGGVGLSLPGCNMRQRRRRLRQTTRRPYMFNCDRIYNITVCTRVMYGDKERYLYSIL